MVSLSTPPLGQKLLGVVVLVSHAKASMYQFRWGVRLSIDQHEKDHGRHEEQEELDLHVRGPLTTHVQREEVAGVCKSLNSTTPDPDGLWKARSNSLNLLN